MMSDQNLEPFGESDDRLARRMRAYTERAVTRIDPAAVAHAAVTARRPTGSVAWPIPIASRTRAGWALVLVALVSLALIGAAIAAGALGPAPFRLAVVPSSSPSASAYEGPAVRVAPPSLDTTSTPIRSAIWAATGRMVETRFGESATLLPNGNVLVAGGEFEFAGHGFARTTAELFDPSTGRWTLTGSMHVARQRHAAVRLADGAVLVVGGYASGGGAPVKLRSAELYDPSTGAWTETGQLAAGRGEATATLLPDGRVLVTGGFNSSVGGSERTAEIYDPVKGTWTGAAPMSVARTGHTATLLPDGHVLVVGGGCCAQPALASAELYDPVRGTWTRTSELVTARRWHSATLLANGQVLVYGGDNNGNDVAVTTAELYDPLTGVWATTGSPSRAGNLFEAQGACQAARLPNGSVLAAAYGGAAELYDPGSGSWTTVAGPIDDHTYVHTCTLLADGRVLVTSEQWPSTGGGPIPVAALFDPSGKP